MVRRSGVARGKMFDFNWMFSDRVVGVKWWKWILMCSWSRTGREERAKCFPTSVCRAQWTLVGKLSCSGVPVVDQFCIRIKMWQYSWTWALLYDCPQPPALSWTPHCGKVLIRTCHWLLHSMINCTSVYRSTTFGLAQGQINRVDSSSAEPGEWMLMAFMRHSWGLRVFVFGGQSQSISCIDLSLILSLLFVTMIYVSQMDVNKSREFRNL